MKNSGKYIESIIHFIIWSVGFFLVVRYVNTLGYIKRDMGNFFYPVALGTIINITIFYLVALRIIPDYSFKNKWKRLVPLLLVTLTGFTLLESILDFSLFPSYYSSSDEPFSSQFLITLIINVFILALAIGYGLIKVWIKGEKQRQELKSEKLVSELNFLKSQVNHHFLFNMLNLAFASATKSGDDFTADLIEKIASQMRYMLYESNEDKVEIGKEMNHIESYITLQKLRISKEMPVTINYQKEGDFSTNRIAPLLLIPFIENAFKYGMSFNEQSEININIHCQNNQLTLNVSNSIKKSTVGADNNSSGIGLQNVKKRLSIIYPNKHNLDISEKNGKFEVHLGILLN